MDTEPEPLSFDEKNSLYMKTVIPVIVILVVFLGYFVYLADTFPRMPMFEFLLRWGLPFFATEMLGWMLTVQVLYHRIVKKSFRFHAKLLGINALFGFAILASFFAVTLGLDISLSQYVGEKNTLLISLMAWCVLIAVATFKFQPFFRKYWKQP
jgi:hypothetical protein